MVWVPLDRNFPYRDRAWSSTAPVLPQQFLPCPQPVLFHLPEDSLQCDAAAALQQSLCSNSCQCRRLRHTFIWCTSAECELLPLHCWSCRNSAVRSLVVVRRQKAGSDWRNDCSSHPRPCSWNTLAEDEKSKKRLNLNEKSKNMGQVHNAFFLPCGNAGGWDPYLCVSFLKRNSLAEIFCFCCTLALWDSLSHKEFHSWFDRL